MEAMKIATMLLIWFIAGVAAAFSPLAIHAARRLSAMVRRQG